MSLLCFLVIVQSLICSVHLIVLLTDLDIENARNECIRKYDYYDEINQIYKQGCYIDSLTVNYWYSMTVSISFGIMIFFEIIFKLKCYILNIILYFINYTLSIGVLVSNFLIRDLLIQFTSIEYLTFFDCISWSLLNCLFLLGISLYYIERSNISDNYQSLSSINIIDINPDESCSICSVSFDSTNYTDSMTTNNENKNENDDKIVKTMCNHIFHEKCITKYINEYKGTRCPLCRTTLII